VAVVALLVGLLIAVEGLMGLVIPGAFVSMVRFFRCSTWRRLFAS
jgi:hypothetical protein